MFRRPESLRERTLLKLIVDQQRTIEQLTDRLMHLAGHTWSLPEQPPAEPPVEDVVYAGALEGLPPGWND